MIEVRDGVKQYGNKSVVDLVSTTIRTGKITSFIGPNGAGKSTLLSMISRLTNKKEGEIFIGGKELGKWDNGELAKKISILKQSNHLNIRLTIRELVSFGRFPHSQGNLTKEDIRYVSSGGLTGTMKMVEEIQLSLKK